MLLKMVRVAGFEPCDLLLTRQALYQLSYIGKKWRTRKESNPQPLVLETSALPVELHMLESGAPRESRTPRIPLLRRARMPVPPSGLYFGCVLTRPWPSHACAVAAPGDQPRHIPPGCALRLSRWLCKGTPEIRRGAVISGPAISLQAAGVRYRPAACSSVFKEPGHRHDRSVACVPNAQEKSPDPLRNPGLW